MSLFDRPAWALSRTSDDEEETEENLFSHSRHAYGQIVAEGQRKKKEHVEKRRAKQEKRNPREQDATKERDDSGGGRTKRRRITLEEGEGLLDEVGLLTERRSRQGGDESSVEPSNDNSRRISPRSNRVSAEDEPRSTVQHKPSVTAAATVIDLGDSSDDNAEVGLATVNAPSAEQAREESDDEFAELRRRARERRRKEEQNTASQPPPDDNTDPQATDRDGSRPPSAPTLDPSIKLLIDSPIPNSTPLIVIRRLSQRLQEIRETWCMKQTFPDHVKAGVFLIHRMHRLYNVTTCRSLGLDVDADGAVTMKGAEGRTGVDRIHLQAVTEEIYSQLKAEKEREEKRRRRGLLSPDEEEAVAQAAASEARAQEEALIRVFLVSKDTPEPYKLKVKPTTYFSKIVAVCRNHFQVAEGQSLFLEFDGERMDPEASVQDSEIADMDRIDVHIA